MSHNNELKVESFNINGHAYEVRHFPAMYNFNLFIKFTSYIGSSFSKFLGLLNGVDLNKLKSGELNGDFASIGEGIYKMLSSIYVNDPEGKIILEILSHTTRDGVVINKETFDRFYTGNIEEMTQVFAKTINIHFSPFLPLKSLFGLLTGGAVEKERTTES